MPVSCRLAVVLFVTLGLIVCIVIPPTTAALPCTSYLSPSPYRSAHFLSNETPIKFLNDRVFVDFAPLYTNWSIKTYGPVPQYDSDHKLISYGCIELLQSLPTLEETDNDALNLQLKFFTYSKTTLHDLFKATYPWTIAKKYTAPGGLVTTYAVNKIGSVQIGINTTTPITPATLDQIDEIATYITEEAHKLGLSSVPIVFHYDFKPRFGSQWSNFGVIYDKYDNWNLAMSAWIDENHDRLEPNHDAVVLVQHPSTASPGTLRIECEVPLSDTAKNTIKMQADHLAELHAITNPSVYYTQWYPLILTRTTCKDATIVIPRGIAQSLSTECTKDWDLKRRYDNSSKFRLNINGVVMTSVNRDLAIQMCNSGPNGKFEQLIPQFGSIPSRGDRWNPLIGGIVLTGAIGRDVRGQVTSGFPYSFESVNGIITVAHLAKTFDQLGKMDFYQPTAVFDKYWIGKVLRYSKSNTADAAFIQCSSDPTNANTIFVDTTESKQLDISGYEPGNIGDTVYMSGSTTDIVFMGSIIRSGTTTTTDPPYDILTDQWFVYSENGLTADLGDSGAPVYKLDQNGHAVIVGLVVGTQTHTSADNVPHGITVVSSYQNIIDNLKIPLIWYTDPPRCADAAPQSQSQSQRESDATVHVPVGHNTKGN